MTIPLTLLLCPFPQSRHSLPKVLPSAGWFHGEAQVSVSGCWSDNSALPVSDLVSVEKIAKN